MHLFYFILGKVLHQSVIFHFRDCSWLLYINTGECVILFYFSLQNVLIPQWQIDPDPCNTFALNYTELNEGDYRATIVLQQPLDYETRVDYRTRLKAVVSSATFLLCSVSLALPCFPGGGNLGCRTQGYQRLVLVWVMKWDSPWYNLCSWRDAFIYLLHGWDFSGYSRIPGFRFCSEINKKKMVLRCIMSVICHLSGFKLTQSHPCN